MDRDQTRVLAALLCISTFYFVAFMFPNSTGAKDPMMISLFEPDEFAQYPVVMRMLEPRQGMEKTLLNFIAYRHYYYGSPFYFGSAVLLIPVKLTSPSDPTQLNMLILRQGISVLPAIVALLLLTWAQTRFRSPALSICLFVLLLSVPAVVENNLWWHADGLALLFVVLTLFFLDRDDLRFGRDFYLAAVCTGLAAGTKVIGLFFIVAIPVYLAVGLVRRQISVKAALLRGLAFVLIMLATIVLSNPFLLLAGERQRMLDLLSRQARSMSEGWTLSYATGPASWLPIIQDLYTTLPFLLLSLVALGYGIWRGRRPMLYLLIACWAIPFGLYILFTIAIKPTHFFLPVLVPLMSSVVVLADAPVFHRLQVRHPTGAPKRSTRATKALVHSNAGKVAWGSAALVVAVLGYQVAGNLVRDYQLYSDALQREQNEGSFAFFQTLQEKFLPLIPGDARLVVFRDVRMYFPEDERWTVRTYWNSSYRTIEKLEPDIIVLWAQRILDYTQEGAQERAIDPAGFQSTYQFYVDADNDQLRGYRLLHRDPTGLFFVSDALYDEYYR